MREIKFRAWDSDNAVMAFSEESDQDAYAWGFENGDMKCWSLLDMEATVDEPAHREALELDGDTMQFTGLKDKNGKEIYEGDVVAPEHESSGRAVVEWREECASFETHWQDGHFDHNCGTWEFLEVIGNIYENPELVKP
jgi:uncharacterized phage protein (TIGR01671 family)